jgi:predicted N-acetyltransferase YhbS
VQARRELAAAAHADLFGAKLRDPEAVAWAAEVGGRVVGSVCLNLFPGTPVAAVGPLTIEPAAQGGPGRALVDAAVAEALRRGIDDVRLVQSPGHLRSFGLYTRAGFALREPLVLVGAKPPGAAPSGGPRVRAATGDDIEACVALAARLVGFGRRHEVAAAVREGIATVAERDGRTVGYAAGVDFRGHVVAERDEDVLALILAAPAIRGPGFFVPARAHRVLDALFAAGLRAVWQAALMTRGGYVEPRGRALPSIAF